MEWSEVATITKEAFRAGATQWLDAARISSGGTVINGPSLILLAPCIGNNFDLNAFLVTTMTRSKVPTKLVRPIAEVLTDTWKSWPGSVSGSHPVFPPFAGWPGPVAQGSAIPIPLGVYLRGDAFEKEPTTLAYLTKDTAPFDNAATGHRADALKTLVGWVHMSWNVWFASTMLVGLFGEGPVPSFAPPKVLAGPVVRGHARSIGPLFSITAFGLRL